VLSTFAVVAAAACASPDEVTIAGVESLPQEITLSEALGIVSSSMSVADYLAVERKRLDWVSACMVGRGFDEFSELQVDESVAEFPFWQLGETGFAAEWGYGVSTTMEASNGSLQPISLGGGVDSLGQILVALGGSRNEAATVALFGRGEAGGGCAGESALLFSIEAVWSVLSEELAELEMNLTSDPRFGDIETDWAHCMSSRTRDIGFIDGVPFQSRIEYFSDVNQLLQEALRIVSALPPIEMMSTLEALHTDERSLAQIDAQCSADVGSRLTTLQVEYEAAFVAKWQAVFHSVRAMQDDLHFAANPFHDIRQRLLAARADVSSMAGQASLPSDQG
jgi:hypothetical protein